MKIPILFRLSAEMKGEEVLEFDPLNYKLLQADLAALPDCLEAPYDDMMY